MSLRLSSFYPTNAVCETVTSAATTQHTWQGSALRLTVAMVLGLLGTMTQMFAGNTPPYGERMLDAFVPYAPLTCLTAGGTIGCGTLTGCSPFTPAAFTSSVLPSPSYASSGYPTLYKWAKSTTATTYTSSNAAQWTIIAGATASTYTPTSLTATTYFVRLANNAACATLVCSNVLKATVTTCTTCNNVTAAGTITASTPSGCLTSGVFTPGVINSTALPTGGAGTIEYVWLVSTNGGTTFTTIAGATASTYTPSNISVTTSYRRCARRSGCTAYVGESNWVTVTVTGACSTCNNVTSAGSIGNSQTVCATSFDPPLINSIALPSGGSTNTIEYVWLVSTNGGSTFTTVAGATGATYDPGVITANTCYRRCARRSGCTAYVGESNWVCFTLNPTYTTSATATPASISAGGNSTLAAAGGAVSYIWSNGQTASAITVTPSATTTYTVTATANTGCTATASVTVTVTAPTCNNVTSAGSIGTSQTVCTTTGSFDPPLITSIALPSGGSTNTIEYVWLVSTNGGTTFTTIAGATGVTYDPGVITTNTCYRRCARRAGCTAYVGESNWVCFTLNWAPSTTITGTTTIAQGASTTLTANNATSYVWSNGGTTAAITVTPSATTTYTVTATNAAGCTATQTVTVTVTAPVCNNVTSAGTIGTSQTVCATSFDPPLITSIADPSGGAGTIEYVWLISTNGTANYTSITGANSSTYDPGVITQTTWFRRCSRRSGCSAFVGESNDIIFTLNTPASVLIAKSNDLSCTATSATLTASGCASYVWSNGATTAATSVTAAGTYTVTATSANGCTATASVTVTLSGVNSTVTSAGAYPQQFQYLCSTGGNMIASVISPSAATCSAGAPSYQWQIKTDAAGSFADIAGATSASYDPGSLAPGSRWYRRLAFCGTCNTTGTPATGWSAYDIHVSNLGVTATANTAAYCASAAPASVVLNATVTDPMTLGTVTYAWSNGGTSATATISPAPTATTTYTVTVTKTIGTSVCTKTANVTVTVNPLPTATATNATICQGQTATLTAGGGGTYAWSNGTTGSTMTSTTAGTFTVTVTGANGCTATATGVVTVNPLPTAAITGNTQVFAGQSTTLTATGGTSYAWSNGATTAANTVSPTTTTTYTVTVTNANGCTSTASTTVTVPNSPSTTNTTICAGATGTVTASGGTAYAWSNGATTASINVSPATTTTYTVTVSNGAASTTLTSVVTVNPLPTATATNATICQGQTATLTAGGGGTYAWSNGTTGSTMTSTTAGTFTVTVTGANGCTATATGVVTVNPLPTAAISGNNQVLVGQSTTLTATGGTSYAWSNGAATAANTVSPTTTTTYTVTVTNANGCTSTASITVTATPVGSIGDKVFADTDADGIQDAGENGVQGVTVTLYNGTTVVATTTTDANGNYLFNNLPAGAYTVGFSNIPAGQFISPVNQGGDDNTDSDANPTTGQTGVINLAAGQNITDVDAGLFAKATLGDKVFADADGDGIQDAGENGVPGVTVTLYDSNNNPIATTTTDGNGNYSFPNLTPGTYSVGFSNLPAGTVFSPTGQGTSGTDSDANPTTGRSNPVVLTSGQTNNTIDAGVITCPAATASKSGDISCTNPSATLTATGGTSFVWSNGATTATTSVTAAGTYTVTATSANGCVSTASVAVSSNTTAPTASITGGDAPLTCAASSATLTAAGGGAYAWSNGGTTAAISVAAAGTYTVTITSANGCTATASKTVTSDNSAPVVTVTNPTICAMGSTNVVATGGGTYAWSGGETTASIWAMPATTATFTVTVTAANGCTASAQATVTVNALPTVTATSSAASVCAAANTVTLTAAGATSYAWSTGATTASITANPTANTTYTVTGTDANGCTKTATVAVTVTQCCNVTNAGQIGVAQSGCGAFDPAPITSIADPSGGAGAIEYVWLISTTGTANYVTIPGANGSTYDPGMITQTTWFRRCSRRAGCSSFVGESNDIIMTVNPVPTASITGGNAPLTCAASSATLTAAGGASYAWSNGATTAATSVSAAGVYTVTVTSAAGCTATASKTVTSDNSAPVVTVTNPTICAMGSTSVVATGGGTYAWSGGETTASIWAMPATTTTFTVTVTAANGCTATAAATVTVNALPTVTATNATVCIGNSATITASGATTYAWSNGSTAATLTSATAGTYTVTGTDTNGCTATAQGVISNYAAASATATAASATINAGSTTALTATGGVSYTWSNGGTGATISVTPATTTTYTVTATDANGCTATATVTVTVNQVGTIGDKVFADTDADGIQDAGELGVAGVTVTLYDSANNVVATTTTDANGNYLFTNVLAGAYTVNFSGLAVGSILSPANQGGDDNLDSDANPTTGTTGVINLAAGQNITDVDAGIFAKATVGDKVFADANGDGIQDLGELGVPGVTVTLYDAANNVVATTTTNANGNYSFTNVNPGTYTIGFTNVPAGSAFSPANQGGNPATDSNTGTNGVTAPFTVTSGQTDNTIDAGLVPAPCLVRPMSNAVATCNSNVYGFYYGGQLWTVVDGSMKELANGTAVIAATYANGTQQVVVTVNLSGKTYTAGVGSPKFGGCVSASNNWYYYPTYTGTLQFSNGTTQTIAPYGPALQVGVGGNLNDASVFGASAWFQDGVTGAYLGDFNFSLGTATPCVNCNQVTSAGTIAAPQAACGGFDPALITSATAPSGGTGALEFIWLSSTDGGANYSIVPGANGLTYNPGPITQTTWFRRCARRAGCSTFTGESNWLKMTVNPVPTASVTGNTTICAGTSGVLTAAGGATFAWSTGEATAAITVNPTASTAYTVTVTSTEGCTASTVVGVQVNTFAGLTGTNATVCAGTTATVGFADATATYVWNTGATTATIAVTPAATTTYTATITAVNGCVATGTVVVTVNVLPTPSITGTTDICAYNQGGTYINYSTVLTATGGVSYAWSNGAATPAISTNVAGVYTVTATNAAGCTATATVTVRAISPTAPGEIAANESVCGAYDPATITSVSAPSGNPAGTTVEYVWLQSTNADFSGATVIAGANGETYDPGFISVTTWFRRCARTVGCSFYNAESNIIKKEVKAIPVVAITGTNTICASTGTTLNATGAATYAWSNGANGANLAVTAVGTYTVTGTSADGCTATASVTVTDLCTAKIGDKVFNDTDADGIQDAGEAGVPAVTVSLYNGTTLVGTQSTDANGNYLFSNLPAGTYTVSFAGLPVGYVFTTQNAGTDDAIDSDVNGTGTTAAIVLANGETNLTVDAGIFGQGSIGDKVFSDTNGDGIQDLGEAGVQGVTVTLYNGTTVVATTTTDANGNYVFNNVNPGTYTVGFSNLPFGFVFSPSNVGTNDDTDSDANSTGQTQAITLNAGQNITNVDAGIRGVAALGNFVFADTNGNGIQDLGELGVPNVTVTLYNGTTVVGTTTTDANGAYSFTNLLPGTYTVNFSNTPANTVFSPANAGTDDTVDSDVNATTGTTGTITLVAGDYNTTVDAGIAPCPTPSITGTATICVGASTTLTAAGGGTYVWSNGDVTAATTVSPTATTVYTVSVTSAAGCVRSTTMTVVVNPVPNVSVNGNAVICAGGSTTLTASATGVYAWSNGETTSSIVVSPAADAAYTVTVTNGFGCSASASQTVVVNANPIAAVADIAICRGNSGTLTATGGASYAWNTGGNTASIIVNPTQTTTYTVTVSSGANCTATATAVVTVNDNPVATIDCKNVVCLGETIQFTAAGGVAYAWSNGQTTATFSDSPLVTAIYTVTVTNAAGCTATATRLVTVNPAATAAITGSNVICNGASTTLTATGGGTYAWSNGSNQAAQTLSPTANTTYTVTVTNAYGCTAVATTAVTVNDAANVSIAGSGAICFGSSATLTATGNGSFVWSTAETTAAITVAPTATTVYTVTVTTAAGCTATATKNVIVNPLPNTQIAGPEAICIGNSTTLTASGGGIYRWNTGATSAALLVTPTATTTYTVTATSGAGCKQSSTFTVTVNALPIATITGTTTICTGTSTTLTAGGGANYAWSNGSTNPTNDVAPTATTTYTVTVTSGANCSTTRSVTVTVNPLPTPEITGSLVICAGQSTALTATGGTAYAWSDGAATATNTVTPLSSTTYTVTVTNSNNCTATVSKYVTVNALPTPVIAGENVICLGKTATLSATGGVSYMWNNGVASSVNAVSPTIATTYTVTATSAEGCTSTATYLVNVNALPTPTITGRNTICLGKSTTLTAGTGDAYAWSTGAATAAITVSPAATTTYTVTATNANGCTQTTAQTVVVNALPVLTVTAPAAICINYTATLTAGTGDQYNWDNGATTAAITVAPTTTTTYSVTATNLLGCTATETRTVVVNSLTLTPMANVTVCNGVTATVGYTNNSNTYAWSNGATTGTISTAPANTTTYTVTVTNTDGCTATAAVTVLVNQLPVITFETPFVICNTESAIITAIAGANDRFVWSTGAATADITVNPSATTTYSVTATSPEGCRATATTELVVNPLPTIRIAGTTTICNTFSTTLTADGGALYYWETGDETAAITVSPTATTTYTVTVTSAEGCASTQSVTVTVNPLPVPSITGTTVVCFGGTSNLTAAGGVSYAWSNGVASAVNTVTPTATTTYTVTVTNGFGCTQTKSQTVTVNPLPVITFTGATTLCAGNGTTITANGGATYLWSNTQSGAALTVTPPATATYTVTATTALGCTATASTTITVNPTPTASVAGTFTICNGQSTTLTTTTNATTATYAWSNGGTTAAITASPSANTIYTVTVTNEFGCTKTASAAVRVNATPVVTFVNTQPVAICAGSCVLVCAQGGVTYAWNTTETAATISVCPTATTSYTVTATNSRGCTATGIIGVTVNPLPTAAITGAQTACANDNVTLTATGGSTFAWSNGANTAAITATATSTTTYVVTVTAAGGCTATASQTVVVNPRTTVVAACSNASICMGANFNLTASPSATNAANTYAWAGPNGFTANVQNPNFTSATTAMSGVYTVTITNQFGCTATATSNVNVALCNTTVSGLVFDDAGQDGVNTGHSEANLENVTVELRDNANTVVATATTDAFGEYTFSNVVPGTYTVQFSNLPAGYVFTTQNAGSSNGSDANAAGVTPAFTVAPGVDVVDVDAGAFAGGASIGDFVWYDANADGLQAGENGIAGVVVTLYDNLGAAITTTTTDANGFYSFPVQAGSYSVGFYRAGWTLTTQTNNTGSGSDANPATGRTMTFAVTTGQNKTDIDAGFTVCACRAAAAPNLAQRTTADQADIRISRNAVSVYPNPSTSDELTVKVFTTAEGSDATVVVMDVTGKQVLTQKTVLASGTNYIRLDVNAIPTGTYFVKVLANGINFEAQKLVRIAE